MLLEPLPSILSEIRFCALEQHKPQSLRLLHLFDGQSAACAYSLNFNVINIGNIVIIIDNIVKALFFLISLDFLLFSFCICKLGVFLVVFGVFLTQKSTDSVSFSTTFGELFLVYSLGKYTRFLVTHPLLAWGWGQKLAKFAVFLVAKILKMHIF